MKLLLSTSLLFLLLMGQRTHAQIGISGSAHPSAALDVKSPNNDKAFYPPRLTTAQRNAIPNPQAGAFVYDLDKGTMYLHDGQNWLPLATTSSGLVPTISRVAADGAEGDWFGARVAISGNYAIVSASSKAIGGNQYQGAAYIFVRSGGSWKQQQRLTANDGTSYDLFGSSVAISEDYAVVGGAGKTVGYNQYQGVVYVFIRTGTTWTQQQVLTANDGSAQDNFGQYVSISGDYFVVGVPQKSINGNSYQGVAYVFVRSGSTWSQQQRLTSSDGAANERFGASIAISGEYIVVGVSNKTINGNALQGAAYVFNRSGGSWNEQQRLVISDAFSGSGGLFGQSVAISGNDIIVGAPFKTINSSVESQGAAYIFSRQNGSWVQQQRLALVNGAFGDNFGTSVGISGDYAVVKTASSYINSKSGATYIYKRSASSWKLQGQALDYLYIDTVSGDTVSISNGTFIVGILRSQNFTGKILFGTVD